jgi:tryptophan synthase alpha chain
VIELERRARSIRDASHKALVIYLMGGMTDDWVQAMRAAVHAGADLIEVGVPFSDPIMDGEVIQRAAIIALERGANMSSVLDDLARSDVQVPMLAMTYYNIVHHHGLERAAADLAAAGVAGTIIPDLPLEELGAWQRASSAAELANVLMVAPSTPLKRAAEIATRSQGFVYAAARMAVTGAAHDDGDAKTVVDAVRRACDTPVYVGIGISTPAQAGAACEFADGVIVGSAVVSRLIDGQGPAGVEKFVSELRRAIS